MHSSSDEPITLPYEIWEMPQLRILQASAVFLTDPTPGKGSERDKCIVLQNLYRLDGVVDLRLTEEVYKRMPNLKELSVRYRHFCDDYCFHSLGRFNKLKYLRIEFNYDSKWRDFVLSLTFPTSLEELCLINSHLWWEDLTIMISSLPHLGSLNLDWVRGSEWNLDEEEFCSLKRLQIWNCDELMYWSANSSHFPILEGLFLLGMDKLSEIPLDIGEIPTLQLIKLEGCGPSAAVSAVRMVMEQETNYGNYDLQLRVEFQKSKRQEFERFQEMLREECLTTNSLHLCYDGKKIEL